jgi:hypothetical protein
MVVVGRDDDDDFGYGDDFDVGSGGHCYGRSKSVSAGGS